MYVAWFSTKEIKDKDSVVNKGQSTELCPLPAAAAESNLGQISSSAAAFPRTALLLPADCDRVLVSWLGRGWLLMELKKMSVFSRGEILTPFKLFQESSSF